MLKRLLLAVAIFTAVLIGIGIISSKPEQDFATQSNIKSTPHKKTICLSMIVKNESSVITKCLASVKDFIDHWVIVDTGSTDGTQKIIKEFMKDIPGTLYERPWVDFSHNRNEALALSKNKADYSLFIDADEMLVFADNFTRPELDQDLYFITVKQKDSSDYLRWFLVNNNLDWKWKGVLHELLESPQAKTQAVIAGVINFSDTTQGARSKNPKKYLDDAETLIKALEKEPDNSRYQFYAAQSFANAGELCLALNEYEKRAKMSGYLEEKFISLYIIARIQEILSMPSNIVISSYMKAHEHTPSRLEPMFYLGLHYMRAKNYEKAYEILKKASLTPLSPTDNLFVETDIGNWKLHSALAEACWNLKKIKETITSCEKVVNCETAPEITRNEMRKNISALKTNYTEAQ
ncbi:MAG: glycosyltransferase [Verrucomicrobia bacterium]|nr:glycosyltransferase [Verrucomicrobiota bacterium]